jgi:PEP-CTERM motif
MKNINDTFSIWLRRWRGGLIAGLALAVSVTSVSAQVYNLSAGTGTIELNLSNPSLVNPLTAWTYNGIDQGSQSFFYTVGGVVYPIDQISSPSAPSFSGAAFDGKILNTNLTTTYANSGLSLTTAFTLSAQGSTLATSLTIQNLATTNQTVQMYQLSSFTLGGLTGGQSVQFLVTTNNWNVLQIGPGGQLLSGYLSGTSLGGSTTVEEMAGTNNLGLATGNLAPNFNDSSLSATGDVDFGYEFTATLTPDSAITISELQTVPEPSSVALVSLGALGFALLRRRGLAFFKK